MMLDLIRENLSTVITGIILAAAVAAAVRKMIKNKGRNGCGGNCSSCKECGKK